MTDEEEEGGEEEEEEDREDDEDVESSAFPPPPPPSSPPAPPRLPSPPRCSNLRILGHAPAYPAGRSPPSSSSSSSHYLSSSSYQLHGLRPYTSYWFLLLPHYKGVLGVPSNLQAFTTPQDVPAGWAVLSRWWAATMGSGMYALTLHWLPLPPHLAQGLILKYLVTVKERDTGVVHNVTVVGDLTSLTLANVTSSRVEVTLAASTVKGFGPTSPPARLNLLMTHFKDPGVGVGMVRSAWFLVLAGGAVAMVLVLVGCVITTRWCARGFTHHHHHHPLPSEIGKEKVGGVGGPWVEVGGLWTPVPTRDLSSDRSERKLLPNGSPSAADYAEVEGGHSSAQLKDDFTKAKLDVWSQGFMCPSPSPSSASTHRVKHLTQTESLPGRSPRSLHKHHHHQLTTHQHSSGSSFLQHHQQQHHIDGGSSSYTTTTTTPVPVRHPSSSGTTCRDSDTSTWYTGECCCNCCREEDVKLLGVPQQQESQSLCPSATPSGCSTVLQVGREQHSDSHQYSPVMEYQYSAIETDTYEAVTTYEEATTLTERGCRNNQLGGRSPLPPPRQMRINTESTTDLSTNGYNFSDEDEEDDMTQSCSDTEASFFIPRDRKREFITRGETKQNGAPYDDIPRSMVGLLRVSRALDESNFPATFGKVAGEERGQKGARKNSKSSLKCPEKQNVEFSTSNTTLTSGNSSSNPMVTETVPKSSVRRVSCHSSASDDSLEDQFEKTLNMIAQGGSTTLDSDYLSTSTYH